VAQVVGAIGGETIATYDQLGQRLRELDAVDRELGRQDSEYQQRRRILEEHLRRGRLAAEVDQLFDRPASDN
jgi:hypothetical protein